MSISFPRRTDPPKIGSAGLFNNMWGRDTDGDRLDGFDFAQKIGTVHGWDADNRDDQPNHADE